MQFAFYDQADTPLFVRDDAESAIWSVDQYSLSLAFPFYKDKEIVRGMRVGFMDADGVFQVFEVRQAKAYEPDHYQEIEAEHIAVAELSDEFCSERDVTDETAESVVESLLTGTRWQVGNVTDDSETVLSAYDETKNHETVGNAMVAVLGTGNVDLLNRPQVPASDLENAGWEDAGTGTATVFSVSYSAGSDGVPYARDLILHMTPIMANGTIKTPAQMETYVDTLLTKKTDAEILARDLPSNNGYGLILWIQTVTGDWDDAYDLADEYDEYLHNMQAAYYLNDFSDLPTADELRGLYAYTKEAAGGTLSSVNIGDGAVWQSIRNVEHNWNVWITPRITVNSTGITGRYLDIAPAEGVWRGVRLSVAKNMDNAGVTYDDSEVKTALYAFGRQKDKEKLTFTDTVWAATQDHPGKPAGQAYLEDPAAKALYGRNGRNRFGFYQNSDITDPVVLLEKTWESLQTQNHPKVTVDCMVADLHRLGYADQDIRLHDKVLVDLPETGKVETLDVIKLDVDLLDPTRTQPTIGAYIPNIIFIDREAGAAARGGYGRNSGQSNAEYERAEFTTEIARNEQEIRLRAYQTDLNRTDAEVLRAFTQIDLDATRIESLATGSGVMLDENGELVVDEDGDPVFITDVAVNFNPATYYPAGTYIKYGGKVYRLTADHIPGQSWDDVSATEEKFGVYSKVIQNADQILLKVNKDDVATQLAVNVGNVTIEGGDLIVDGMITASHLATNTITVHGLIVDNGGCNLGNANVYLNGASMLLGVYNLSLTPNGNNYTLSWMDYGGTSHSVDFSRGSSGSVTLSGTWGDWDFTVTPTPLIGTPLVETFTFTPSPNTNTPLNITHFSAHKASVSITSTNNQGLWKQILIDATGEYNQGVTDGAGFDLTDVGLTAAMIGTPTTVGNFWYADVDITKDCTGMTSDTETVSVNVQPAVNVGVQAGFDMCHGTIVLDPSTDQTINPSGSVTVSVKAHATPSSTTATEVASITVKANSGFPHSMTINRKAYNVQKGNYFDTRFYRRNADGTINTSAYIDVTAGHSVYTSATNVGSSGKTVWYS